FFLFSSRRRHTRFSRDWSSDVCSSDLRLRLYHKGKEVCDVPVHTLVDGAPVYVRQGSVPAYYKENRDVNVNRTLETDNWEMALRSEERRVGKEWRTRDA